MNATLSQSRSNDIGAIKESIVSYVTKVKTILPEGHLVPAIFASDEKSETRGFNHPMLTRFLCPVESYADLMADPDT